MALTLRLPKLTVFSELSAFVELNHDKSLSTGEMSRAL